MKLRDESRQLISTTWRHHHVLDMDELTKEDVSLVFTTADAMKEVLSREIKLVPALRGKTVVTLFYEPSTRTRASFELAAKHLSADVVSMASATSSVAKGESLVDTVHTLESLGADVIILRHPCSGAPYLVAHHSRASIINAGDGWHAHPTQALLDLFTVKEARKQLEGLKVAIVGDILHSRVARSNIWGFTIMGAEVTLCGPPPLLPLWWAKAFPWVRLEWNLERALAGADVIMALRLQLERQDGEFGLSLREYIQSYQINAPRLSLAQADALLLHPGPVNEGVELSLEVSQGSQSLIQSQVNNGVAIRMALLYLLCGGGG